MAIKTANEIRRAFDFEHNITNDLDRYIVAMCCLLDDLSDENIKDTLKKIVDTSEYAFFKESIINSHFRFARATELFDYELLTSPMGFNIIPPLDYSRGKPLDIHFFVRRLREMEQMNKLLDQSINVIIKGPVKIGKTRLVYDYFKGKKGYFMFALRSDFILKNHHLEFIKNVQKNKTIIWFIDDIQYYSLQLNKLSNIQEEFQFHGINLKIIATLRSDKTIPDNIFTKNFAYLDISPWDENEINDISTYYKKKSSSTLIFSPFALLCNMDLIRINYNNLKPTAKLIFYYIGLLREFMEIIDYELLQIVFMKLQKHKLSKVDFEIGLNELMHKGFINQQSVDVTTWDLYITEFTLNDHKNRSSDLEKIIPILRDNNRLIELLLLAFHFNLSKDYINVSNCYRNGLKLINKSDNDFLVDFYLLWIINLDYLKTKYTDKKRIRLISSLLFKATLLDVHNTEIHITSGKYRIHLIQELIINNQNIFFFSKIISSIKIFIQLQLAMQEFKTAFTADPFLTESYDYFFLTTQIMNQQFPKLSFNNRKYLSGLQTITIVNKVKKKQPIDEDLMNLQKNYPEEVPICHVLLTSIKIIRNPSALHPRLIDELKAEKGKSKLADIIISTVVDNKKPSFPSSFAPPLERACKICACGLFKILHKDK